MFEPHDQKNGGSKMPVMVPNDIYLGAKNAENHVLLRPDYVYEMRSGTPCHQLIREPKCSNPYSDFEVERSRGPYFPQLS